MCARRSCRLSQAPRTCLGHRDRVADCGQCGVLTDLDLSENVIGVAGAKAIGEAIAVNEVLTTLDLCANDLGDEGKGVIRDAVSGRVGFELNM